MEDVSIARRISNDLKTWVPIPVAARSKAWVCSRSLARIAGFESCLGHGNLSVVSVVCCQVEFCALG